MRLWPFRRLSFETSLSCEETLKRLREEIGPTRWEISVGPFNTYVTSNVDRRAFPGRGLADGAEFRINVNSEPGELKQFNSFQALVRARIEPSVRGAAVQASMRLHAFPMIFLMIFLSPFILTTAYVAQTMLRGETAPWTVLFPLAFILVVWLFVSFAFSEDTAERLLRAILERE